VSKPAFLIFILVTGCDQVPAFTDQQKAKLFAQDVHQQIGRYQPLPEKGTEPRLILDTVSGCVFGVSGSLSQTGQLLVQKSSAVLDHHLDETCGSGTGDTRKIEMFTKEQIEAEIKRRRLTPDATDGNKSK